MLECEKHLPVAPGLLLSDPPAQVDLVHVHKVSLSARPELGEHEPREQITLAVHVPERGRDEHTTRTPPRRQEQGYSCIFMYKTCIFRGL